MNFISLLSNVFLLISVLSPMEFSSAIKDRSYYESRGDIIWDFPTDQKVICLTFDDGPDQRYTPQILDLLQKYEAKATFFVTGGQIEKYPQLAERQILENHELANHTFTHPDLTSLTLKKLKKEILKTEDALLSITGVRPHLFRPPGGYYNEEVINVAKQAGYTLVMWSWHQDTKDWAKPGVDRIVNKVTSNARNGDIVLFHDFDGNQTVKALEKILPELKREGYEFITVSELLQIKEMADFPREALE